METRAKRRKTEKILPLTYTQWTIVYLGVILNCDMPVLEAVFLATFRHVDLLLATDPVRLWANMLTSPRHHRRLKLEWWKRFVEFITPLMERLFPTASRFRQLSYWVNCNTCHERDRELRPHYPVSGGFEHEWSFSCREVSISKGLQPYTYHQPHFSWIEERIKARIIMERSREATYNIYPIDGSERLLLHGWEVVTTCNSVLVNVSDWMDCRFSPNYFTFSYTDLCAFLKLPKVLKMPKIKQAAS
jgi:hypothetical protein